MPFKIEFLDGAFENSTSVKELEYRKVRSSNTSRLEAHDGFQIAYEGDFQSLYNVNFWKKVDFLISNACYYLRLYGG